jgi:hypothetical protein
MWTRKPGTLSALKAPGSSQGRIKQEFVQGFIGLLQGDINAHSK